MAACRQGALRVGGGYIYVDTSSCDACSACADACARRAISITSAREAADGAEGRVVWTLRDAAVVLAVMSASLVATRLLMTSDAVVAMVPEARALLRSATLVAFFAIQLLTVTTLARLRGASLVRAFGLRRLRRRMSYVATTVAFVIVLLMVTRGVAYAWAAVARAAGWAPPDGAALTALFGGGGLGLALAMVSLVVLGPVAEELCFRGVVLGALGARWGAWAGIVSTAVVFAISHLTAWTFLPLVTLGIAAGCLAWFRRSLLAAISLHALYNGVVVAAAYWLAR